MWAELTLSPSSPGGPGGPPGPGRPTGPWIPSLPAGPWGPFSPYFIDWHNTSLVISHPPSEILDDLSNVGFLLVLLSLQLGLEVLEVQVVQEDQWVQLGRRDHAHQENPRISSKNNMKVRWNIADIKALLLPGTFMLRLNLNRHLFQKQKTMRVQTR